MPLRLAVEVRELAGVAWFLVEFRFVRVHATDDDIGTLVREADLANQPVRWNTWSSAPVTLAARAAPTTSALDRTCGNTAASMMAAELSLRRSSAKQTTTGTSG
jgi:hypothetical protein